MSMIVRERLGEDAPTPPADPVAVQDATPPAEAPMAVQEPAPQPAALAARQRQPVSVRPAVPINFAH
jgi:hypothetical protein